MLGPRLRNGIIILVSAVWGANFVAGFAVPGYEPDPQVHVVFMAIVGGLFALDQRKKPRDESDDSSESGGRHG